MERFTRPAEWIFDNNLSHNDLQYVHKFIHMVHVLLCYALTWFETAPLNIGRQVTSMC